MRILLVSIGTAGDLLPFIALGKALRRRGHDVRVLGNAFFRPVAEREGLHFVEVCSVEEHVRRTRQRSRWTLQRSFQEGAANLLADMPRVYDAIADHYLPGRTVAAAAGMMFGARIAQEKLGLSLATVHLYPLCFRSIHDEVSWPRWLPRRLRAAAYRLFDRIIDSRLAPSINAFRAGLGLAPVRGILASWWNSPQCVLGLFPDWLCRPQVDWPANTVLTGFPLYDSLQPFEADKQLEDFLSDGEPPLVFSHSSAVLDAREFFADSVRIAGALGRRAVLLTPHAEQVPQPLPSGIRHFPFAPHSRLLPRSAALVHHGGIGTAFQALAAGIPQLIAPVFLDQPDNGRRLTRLGVAATLRPGVCRPREATDKLRHLLESFEVTQRCQSYAARCRAENPVEKVCAVIERLHADRA